MSKDSQVSPYLLNPTDSKFSSKLHMSEQNMIQMPQFHLIASANSTSYLIPNKPFDSYTNLDGKRHCKLVLYSNS